jgi:hypothetical protein
MRARPQRAHVVFGEHVASHLEADADVRRVVARPPREGRGVKGRGVRQHEVQVDRADVARVRNLDRPTIAPSRRRVSTAASNTASTSVSSRSAK